MFEEDAEELTVEKDYGYFVCGAVVFAHGFVYSPTPQDQFITLMFSIFFGIGCGFLRRCVLHFKFKRIHAEKNWHRTLMFIRKPIRCRITEAMKFREAPVQYRIVPRNAWWLHCDRAVGQSEIILTEKPELNVDREGVQHKHLRVYKGGKS